LLEKNKKRRFFEMSNEILKIKDGMSFKLPLSDQSGEKGNSYRIPSEYANKIRILSLKYNTTHVAIICEIIRYFMQNHEKELPSPLVYGHTIRVLNLKYNTTNISIICWAIRFYIENHEREMLNLQQAR